MPFNFIYLPSERVAFSILGGGEYTSCHLNRKSFPIINLQILFFLLSFTTFIFKFINKINISYIYIKNGQLRSSLLQNYTAKLSFILPKYNYIYSFFIIYIANIFMNSFNASINIFVIKSGSIL